MATAANVGSLNIQMGANTAQYTAAMRRAQVTARQTGQNIERAMTGMSVRTSQAFAGIRVAAAGLGVALGVGFFVNQVRSTLQWASSLSEAAQQIGVTVEQLQVLQHAAQQNGVSAEGMARAVGILNRTLGQAQGGNEAAMRSFTRLPGITREMVMGFNGVGEAIPAVNEGLSKFANSSQMAAAGATLYGRGVRELLPLIAQGRAGWDAATQAAIRNGMVTQEQADKADRAADSLAELGSVLRVQLLGAVVDALPGLLEIVRVLGQIISFAIRAIGFIGRVIGALTRPVNLNGVSDAVRGVVGRVSGQPGMGSGVAAAALRAPRRTQLDLLTPRTGGGGGGGGGNNHEAEQAARRAQQVEQEARRLQIEELQARREQIEDLDQRNEIAGQIAELERQQWLSEKMFALRQGELTQAQFDRLVALQGIKLTTEEIGRRLEHTRAGQERENEIAADQAQAQEAMLQAQIGLARTAEERRRLELELLEIQYRNRRALLETTIRQRPGSSEAQSAEAELARMGGRQRVEQQAIMRNTMGPLERYMTELPRTAEQVREALQSVAVDGLQSISDGLVDVITGARKMGDVFKNVVTGIIADLIRIQVQRAIIGPLANALGGIFGGAGTGGFDAGALIKGAIGLNFGGARAAGGPTLPGRTYLVGEKGPELLRMGGSGGQVIPNDNLGGSGVVVNQYFQPNIAGNAATKEEMVYLAGMVKPLAIEAYRDLARRRG